ncbi:carbohydrate ABC transporter permease [Schaalia vaccimaxillae]|uniref:carbohydrate ABC transporter permease n=1 Tax=Schaalia vaccimaxillae TaxID=183916 RepID=UPI0003B5F042|nr:sugar ABC transporter permease [Schaalia vaccimaxillae]
MTTTTPTSAPIQPEPIAGKTKTKKRRGSKLDSYYPLYFHIPAGIFFIVLFLIPTLASFYFSLNRWTLFEMDFIGLDNFVQFFKEPALVKGFINTFIYAFITSAAKVVLGLALAVLLTSQVFGRNYLRSVVFFPVLVSTIGVGVTWKVLLDPQDGLVNRVLSVIGIDGPGWLTNPNLALFSVAGVDVWKGVGLATVIYIAGIVAIPKDYVEAAKMDGAGSWEIFKNITLPLSRPATVTVIILSLIGGLRSFDLIWTMTRGGPGFSSDVIASVIYKQYQAGFYGLSTAGNVVLFLVIALIVIPLNIWLNRKADNQ